MALRWHFFLTLRCTVYLKYPNYREIRDELFEDETLLAVRADEKGADEKGADEEETVDRHTIVDKNGWFRVDTQPIKQYPFVRTASLSNAHKLVRASVCRNLIETDGKLLGNESIPERMEAIQIDVHRRFLHNTGDWIRMVFDYTGLDMSWSPSSLRVSLEAIYPLTVVDGKHLYHALPNVCNVIVSLNLLKRKNPILVLPLLGQFLRTHHEADFQQRKAVWTWIYNATYNVGVIVRDQQHRYEARWRCKCYSILRIES